MTLKMSGVAHDVNSVALQADIFGKSGVITNAIFSGINQQSDGVHFEVSALINPSAINYEGLVTGQPAAGVNQLPASTASSTQTAGGASPFKGSTQQTPQAPSATGAPR